MGITNRWRGIKEWFSPKTLEEKNTALGKRAKQVEKRAGHAEKEAALRKRIAEAEKRIKESQPPNILTHISGSIRALIVLVLILAIVLLVVKVC